MKRKVLAVPIALAAIVVAVGGAGASPAAAPSCTTIQQGELTDAFGNPIRMGYDQFGYNYQAHTFVGTYDGADRVLDGTYYGANGGLADDHLVMKWSDDWLSNMDCDGDGKLDRGVGGVSLGWLVNQVSGDYDSDGNGTQDAHYTHFVKIVYVGPGGSLWGQYNIILELTNDPLRSLHGLQYKVAAPGLGLRNQWIH